MGFKEGLAPVVVNGTWGFINKTGTLVIANQFNWVAQFSEGVAIVDRSSEFLVIDTNDQVLANLNQKKLSPDIDDARFSEGLMPVFSEEKEVMGYINKSFEFGKNVQALASWEKQPPVSAAVNS